MLTTCSSVPPAMDVFISSTRRVTWWSRTALAKASLDGKKW